MARSITDEDLELLVQRVRLVDDVVLLERPGADIRVSDVLQRLFEAERKLTRPIDEDWRGDIEKLVDGADDEKVFSVSAFTLRSLLAATH